MDTLISPRPLAGLGESEPDRWGFGVAKTKQQVEDSVPDQSTRLALAGARALSSTNRSDNFAACEPSLWGGSGSRPMYSTSWPRALAARRVQMACCDPGFRCRGTPTKWPPQTILGHSLLAGPPLLSASPTFPARLAQSRQDPGKWHRGPFPPSQELLAHLPQSACHPVPFFSNEKLCVSLPAICGWLRTRAGQAPRSGSFPPY